MSQVWTDPTALGLASQTSARDTERSLGQNEQLAAGYRGQKIAKIQEQGATQRMGMGLQAQVSMQKSQQQAQAESQGRDAELQKYLTGLDRDLKLKMLDLGQQHEGAMRSGDRDLAREVMAKQADLWEKHLKLEETKVALGNSTALAAIEAGKEGPRQLADLMRQILAQKQGTAAAQAAITKVAEARFKPDTDVYGEIRQSLRGRGPSTMTPTEIKEAMETPTILHYLETKGMLDAPQRAFMSWWLRAKPGEAPPEGLDTSVGGRAITTSLAALSVLAARTAAGRGQDTGGASAALQGALKQHLGPTAAKVMGSPVMPLPFYLTVWDLITKGSGSQLEAGTNRQGVTANIEDAIFQIKTRLATDDKNQPIKAMAFPDRGAHGITQSMVTAHESGQSPRQALQDQVRTTLNDPTWRDVSPINGAGLQDLLGIDPWAAEDTAQVALGANALGLPVGTGAEWFAQ